MMETLFTRSARFALVISTFFGISETSAQTLGIYQFSGSGACPHAHTDVTVQPANAEFSNFSSVNTTCVVSNDVFNVKALNTSATIDLTEYNQFKIMPSSCFRMDLLTLKFDHKLSTGSANWYVRTNLDHFAADLSAGTSSASVQTATIHLPPSDFTGIDTVIFRIYISGIAAGTTTWRQDNVAVTGSVYSISPLSYYPDNDNDGFGAGTAVIMCSNPGGFSLLDTDCDDQDPEINPNTIWFADADNDGFGDENQTETGCSSSLVNAVMVGGDCEDEDDEIHPETIWYEDQDQDGYGNNAVFETGCVSSYARASLNGLDCNDQEAAVHPGSTEICDGFDNNCDGQINEGMTLLLYYIDNDGDSYGTGAAQHFCSDPGIGYAEIGGDCDDDDDLTYPGALEICDGVDNNCNSTIDEGFELTVYYEDTDGDGFGAGAGQSYCENPGAGFSLSNTDCNNTNPAIYPGAVEISGNGIDENCDGTDGYLGLAELDQNTFEIFPNPGNDFAKMKINSKSGRGEVQIFSVSGVLLQTTELDGKDEIELNTASLVSGIYLIVLLDEGRSAVARWTKD